jgi:Flp pilus assembly protein TadD
LVREKAPLFLLAAASCAVTYLAQTRSSVVPQLEFLPFGVRISNAFVSYVAYLGKMVWSWSLAVFYPHPASIQSDVLAWEVAGSLLLLCGISVVAARNGFHRPCLAVGWLWYVGTLIPVIGLIQVGAQAYADRYAYVPLIGVFIAVAWGIPPLLSGRRHRRFALGAVAGVSLVALSVGAWVQAGYWRGSVTLLTRALAVTDRNWLAWNNLGVSYNEIGRYQQASGYLREALRIKPGFAQAANNLGVSYSNLGDYRKAADYFEKSLRIAPGLTEAWNNLGAAYNGLGRYQQAIGCIREALRNKPDFVDAWYNLGVSFNGIGDHRQAIASFRETLRMRPDYVKAWNGLGVSCSGLGRHREAIDYFREALRIKPDYDTARNNLAAASGEPRNSRSVAGAPAIP